jgi:integrase
VTLDLSGFENYLRDLDYADQTIDHTLSRAQRLEALRTSGDRNPVLLPVHWRTYLKRIAAGGEAGRLPAELATYASACVEMQTAARKARTLRGGRKKAGRKKLAVSVPDADWVKLLQALKDPARPYPGPRAVLHVEAATALRIGDILRIPRKDLLSGVRTGVLEIVQKGGGKRILHIAGAPEAWAQLASYCEAAPMSSNVARCISLSENVSSSGAAYKACERVLKQLQEELGLDRLYSHRLRRTMAVQTARVTEDISIVGQMLGHVPGSKATPTYVDEARPERVAETIRRRCLMLKKIWDEYDALIIVAAILAAWARR